MPKGDATKSRHAAAYRAKAMAPPPTCEPTAEQREAIAATHNARSIWLDVATPEAAAAYLRAQQCARLVGVAWVQCAPGTWDLKALANVRPKRPRKRTRGWAFRTTKGALDA